MTISPGDYTGRQNLFGYAMACADRLPGFAAGPASSGEPAPRLPAKKRSTAPGGHERITRYAVGRGPGMLDPGGRNLLSRRDLLWHLGGGLGGIALAHLLGRGGLLAGEAITG